jgi:hypothetical protein
MIVTLQLLHDIAQQRLPMDIMDMAEIDKLRLLRAAGLVSMLITNKPVDADPPQWACVARVLAITPEGVQALRVAAQGETLRLAAPALVIDHAATSSTQP